MRKCGLLGFEDVPGSLFEWHPASADLGFDATAPAAANSMTIRPVRVDVDAGVFGEGGLSHMPLPALSGEPFGESRGWEELAQNNNCVAHADCPSAMTGVQG